MDLYVIEEYHEIIQNNKIIGTHNSLNVQSASVLLLLLLVVVVVVVVVVVKLKVKQSRYRPGVTQRVPGSLCAQIS
jgi:sensor domain CHASE-containing protein